MPEIGVVIKAVSKGVNATLAGIGSAAKKSLGAVRAVADKAKASFDAFGKVAAGLNATLEIGKKAWEVLRMAVGETIAKALEFRKAGDPVLKWFADMKRDTELLRASIGDALIPVVQGLAEGFGLVGRGARDWVRENRKLIASKLLEWIMNIGNILIKSVAKGALLVVKAWKGWEQAINVVKSIAQDMFGAILSGVAKTIEGMAKVVGVFDEHLAQGMLKAADMARGFGDEMEQASERSVDAVFKSNAEMVALEKQIDKVEKVALVKLAKAGEIAQKKIQESIAGTNKTLEEQQKTADETAAKQIEAGKKLDKFLNGRYRAMIKRRELDAAKQIEAGKKVDEFLAGRHEARIKRLELEESILKELEAKEIERAEKIQEKQDETAESVASNADFIAGQFAFAINTFGQEVARANQLMAEAQEAVAAGAADATEKVNAARQAQAQVAGATAKQTAISVIDSVSAQVAAFAVQAAAGAFAGMTTIPVVGVALGAVAAAAAAAAVMALGAGLKGLVSGLQGGGVIKGGVAGQDSVPAMLMPGEQVMSVPERQAMQLFMGRLLGAQAGQTAVGLPVADGVGGQSVVVNQKTEIRTWVPNIVEETKMARRMERGARRRLAQQQMLLGQAAM